MKKKKLKMEVIDIHNTPICPKCFKPMTKDKENSSKYNSYWYCCNLGLSIG